MTFCDFFRMCNIEDFCNIKHKDLKCCPDEPDPIKRMKIILEKIRRNSIKLGFYHNARYNKYRAWLFYFFRLPSLIISGVNGFLAIGLKSFTKKQDAISVTNAVMSFVCSIITSIEISLNLQKRMESELDSYKRFYKLTVEIDKELVIYDYKKDSDCSKFQDFLEKKYNEYQSIVQGSNIVTSEVIISEDEFEWVYKDDATKNKDLLCKIRNDTINIFPQFNSDKQCQSISNDCNKSKITSTEKSTQITKYEQNEILDVNNKPSSPRKNQVITFELDDKIKDKDEVEDEDNEEENKKKQKKANRKSMNSLRIFGGGSSTLQLTKDSKNKVVEEKYSEMMVSTSDSCNDNLCKSCNSPTCCCSYELC